MKSPGIIGTIQLAATLVFAIPVALFGIDSLLSGRTLMGAAFLGVAALMVGLQQYLTTPTDVPAAAAEKAVGAFVTDDDEK